MLGNIPKTVRNVLDHGESLKFRLNLWSFIVFNSFDDIFSSSVFGVAVYNEEKRT
jgi:hypothetical protein